ncbi:MAG: DUF2231 domain-containing protein [Bacteroidia bacterium]
MHWHPMIVHFPIALLVVAGVAYVLAWYNMEQIRWSEGGYYLHILGLAGMVLAVLSGGQAEGELVRTPLIGDLLSRHELLGYLALWSMALLLVWQYVRQRRTARRERLLFALVFWLCIGLMAAGAYQGGRLVYEAGAGVEPMIPYLRQQLPTEPAP